MENKTITLTVAEFRKNVKASLDFCVQGGVVIIDRMGQRFMLSQLPQDVFIAIDSSKKDGTATVIAKKTDDGGIEVLQTSYTPPKKIESDSQANEQPCCKKATPCKHWIWSEDQQVYINTLSNRERQPE